MADDVLKQAISGITNLERVINLDRADMYTVMANKGSAYMGTGTKKAALSSPLISQPM